VLEWRQRMGVSTFPFMEGGMEAFLEFVSSLGLRYVEIRSERPYALPQDLEREGAEGLRERLQDLGLEPIVHSAVYDINLASLNPLIRRASIRQTVESIRLASLLGAKIVVIHPGRLPKNYPREYLSNSRINLLTSLRIMARIAGRMGVTLAVENSPRGRAHRLVATPQEHLYILEKVSSPHIGALLDLGHAHTWGFDLREYINLLKDHVVAFHIHDNHGSSDEHLPLGRGNMDVKGVMEEIRSLDRTLPVVLILHSRKDVSESLAFLEREQRERGIWGRIFRREAVR